MERVFHGKMLMIEIMNHLNSNRQTQQLGCGRKDNKICRKGKRRKTRTGFE